MSTPITSSADLPEAVDNTLVVAQRCAYMPDARKPILPAFPSPAGRTETDELRAQALEGLEHRLALLAAQENLEPGSAEFEARARPYRQRLEFELETINAMGYAGYFLIVADFIQWAKRQGIPMGPGRGCGAGSVVAWSLTITDLDPLRWGLLFERFLNPERVSMPDFDIDFCQARRGEVIQYVVLIGLDTSGSMGAALTGLRGWGATSKMRCVDVAALFAAAILRRNPDSVVVPFDTAAYEAKVDPQDTILSLAERLAKYGGGGTDCSLPLVQANGKYAKRRFAGVVLVSDNESWVYAGRAFASGLQGATGVMTEWQRFAANQQRLGNDRPKLVCIALKVRTRPRRLRSGKTSRTSVASVTPCSASWRRS